MARSPNAPTVLTIARAAAVEVANRVSPDPVSRANFCLDLLQSAYAEGKLGQFLAAIAPLSVDERHYWVGTFYTLLLTLEQRRAQAAYFTPPYIANAVLDLVLKAGFDLAKDDVLDPAAGGAAFLSTIASRMRSVGLEDDDIAYRLNGIEIDPGLAAISEALIQRRIQPDVDAIEARGPSGRRMIATGDALRMKPLAAYDLVIANPPYGRVREADLPDDAWKAIARSGHVNKYALFTEYCLRMTKPGGIAALVIPSSFRAGPLYDKMRSHIRSQGQILALGHVSGRDDVFVDVAQDVSVLIVRKGARHKTRVSVSFPSIEPRPSSSQPIKRTLPSDPARPWPTPEHDDGVLGGAVLADYGADVRSGYFVWNREQHRMSSNAGQDTFPLIWARNVKAGLDCKPISKSGIGIDHVSVDPDSQAIIRIPALVLQRTTNNKQPRRLIASMVQKSVYRRWKGFVSENHTIVITCPDWERIGLLEKLLNTRAVDRRYRRVSGTAAVSVTLLRELDLPTPERFARALEQAGGDAELAADLAYDVDAFIGLELEPT